MIKSLGEKTLSEFSVITRTSFSPITIHPLGVLKTPVALPIPTNEMSVDKSINSSVFV